MSIIRCLFCQEMTRLGVRKHNHNKCQRSLKINCDCGCWQAFIQEEIKAKDRAELIQEHLMTEERYDEAGRQIVGGHIMKPGEQDA